MFLVFSCDMFRIAMLEADFVMNSAVEPESLDPIQLQTVSGQHVLMALYEGLVTYDAACSRIVPAAAESWTSNDDCSVWTFKLGEGYWSDGTRLSAADFVAGCFRNLEADLDSEVSLPLTLSIRGAAAYQAGRSRDRDSVGILALNERTLQFELCGPMPYFPEFCADPAFYPFPAHAGTTAFFGSPAEGVSRANAAQLIGNGPFILSEWKPGFCLVLEKNPGYKGPNPALLERPALLFITDAEKARILFKQGFIDWDFLDGQYISDAADIAFPANDLYYIAYKLDLPPFDAVAVRKALTAAIDSCGLNGLLHKPVFCSREYVPASVLPAGRNTVPFNPAEARRLLEEAGYADPASFPSFSILCDDNSLHISIAEYLAEQWRQHLGLHCVAEVKDRSSFARAQFIDKEFSLARRGWKGPITDLLFYLEHLLGSVSPEYDDIVYTAMNPADPEAGMALLAKARAELETEAPFIPLFQSALLNRIDTDKWDGWHANALNIHRLSCIQKRR